MSASTRRAARAAGACALALSAAAVHAGPPPNEAAGIRHYRLTNGLDVVVAVRPELQLLAVNLTAAVGSIDDPPGQSGMAHLLEHVTLGGSVTVGTRDPEAERIALERLDRADRALREARREQATDPQRQLRLEQDVARATQDARQAAEEGEILGGRLEARGAIGLNATTSADATQYFGWIPRGDLELWVSLEADRLKHPIFRRFYSEREVVLKEIAVLTNGKPTLQDRVMSDVFPGGAQAQPRAGDPEQTRELDRPLAFEYFRRFYRPENLALAVVGDVDPEAVHRLCERYLGDWRPSGPSERVPPGAPLAAGTHVRSFNSVRSPVVFFAYPRPPLGPADKAALDVLAVLLNSDELSPLKRRLVDEAGRAHSLAVDAAYPSHKRPAVFLLWIGGNPGVRHETLIAEARGILETLAGVSDEDLAGAALQAEMKLAVELDDPPTLAATLAEQQAVHGDWHIPFEQLDQLRRLSARDVRAVAGRTFLPPVAEPGGHGR